MTRTPERIHVDHSTISRLGYWTSATAFEVRSRKGKAVVNKAAALIGIASPDIRESSVTPG